VTAVMLLGDLPSTGLLGAAAAQRLDVHAASEGLPWLIDRMAHALRGHGAVLVVYPSWEAEAARRVISLARGVLLTDRIAGMPLDLPPLALSLVADQLAFVSQYVRPGVLASMAPRLAGEVFAGAWVNSVANLDHIAIGLGAHLSSYLPGSGFSVTAAPAAEVHRISSSEPVPTITRRPVDPVLLLVANGNGDLDWVRQRLVPAMGVASIIESAAQPLSPKFWGTKKYVEFVAFSGHPQAFQGLLRLTVCRPCGWCEEPTALAKCPFCSMVQPGQQVRHAPQQSPMATGYGQTVSASSPLHFAAADRQPHNGSTQQFQPPRRSAASPQPLGQPAQQRQEQRPRTYWPAQDGRQRSDSTRGVPSPRHSGTAQSSDLAEQTRASISGTEKTLPKRPPVGDVPARTPSVGNGLRSTRDDVPFARVKEQREPEPSAPPAADNNAGMPDGIPGPNRVEWPGRTQTVVFRRVPKP